MDAHCDVSEATNMLARSRPALALRTAHPNFPPRSPARVSPAVSTVRPLVRKYDKYARSCQAFDALLSLGRKAFDMRWSCPTYFVRFLKEVDDPSALRVVAVNNRQSVIIAWVGTTVRFQGRMPRGRYASMRRGLRRRTAEGVIIYRERNERARGSATKRGKKDDPT